jgi:predicted ATPase
MIERIYATNYRAFEDLDIDLSKINLFFGPNNSGKSSILSLISVLSQTLNSSDHSVPLLLRGSKEDLGTYGDMVHNHNTEDAITIGIQIKPFEKEPQKSLKVEKKPFNAIIELKYGFRPIRHEIVLNQIMLEFPSEDIKLKIEKSKSYSSNNYYLTKLKIKEKESDKHIKVEFLNHFLPYLYSDIFESSKIRYKFLNFPFTFAREIKDIEFIGAFREPPKRTYMFSGENPGSVGTHGERAIDLMLIDYFKQGREKKQIVNLISKWFKKSEISEKININTISDRHLEIKLSQIRKNPDSSDKQDNLVDVGYGCSQILPILVAGYSLSEGKILMVQEPEIHLHPKAQAELGTFFYELAKKGVQSIIETHSEHLLLRLQAHVADKRSGLSPSDVRIYYVNVKDGKRVIERLYLKENGFFENEWPEGFFPERYNEAKKIALGKI